MKIKTLLLFLLLYLGFLSTANAQMTAASATWALSSTSAQTVTTSGQVNGTDEQLAVLSINQYTGTFLSQRLRVNSAIAPSSTAGWPANQTSEISGVYIQFAISPKSGNKLHVNSLSMIICAMSNSNVKANVYYSTDPTFATSTQISYSTGLTNNYLPASSTAATTGTPNPNNITPVTVSASSLDILVDAGQTFYVRVCPWIELLSAPNASKYFCIQNVVINGQTESLSVASKIVWPCSTDLSNVTTGNLVGTTPTFGSPLVKYGSSLSYGGVNGVSFYTNAIWQPETAPVEGRYMQFTASPKTGGTFVVDSITLKMAAWYTDDFRVSIYYSKDASFTMATGTALIQDVAVTNGAFSKTKGTVNLTVNSGETIYFRLYPYHLSLSGDKNKLIGLNDVSIYGGVTGVTSDPPTLTTNGISYISSTFVTCGGNISSDGGAAVTERGLVWNTSTAPTTTNSKVTSGTGSGSFSIQAKSLTPNTTYYLRAYAINSTGTSYGNEQTFTTLAAIVPPTVTKTAASSILVTSANAGGNATAWGGDTIKSKGVCWNSTGNPTIADSKTLNGTDLGSFTSILYPLVANTKYYFKAYATNSAGTGYSVVDSFTTQTPAADIIKTVAKDGSGDYTTVQAALNAAPVNYTGKYIINIKPGTYYEKDTVVAGKVNILLKGIHPDSTIITYNAYADSPKAGGGTMGTNGCYTFGVNANDFTAINVTFQNTIKNDGTHGNEQAVALFTNADRLTFINCKLLGYQDTYYAGGGSNMGRTYMKNCYIEGSVDYIFGNATALFDSCEMHSNRDNSPLTAPSTNASSKFGYVFRNCKISADSIGFNGVKITKVFLGRPWQNAPQSVYINCYEPLVLAPEGWTTMSVNPGLFAEYKCTGPGYSPSTRSTNAASLGKQLSDADAAAYTLVNIFKQTTNSAFGYDWLPDTTIYKFKQNTGLGSIATKKYGDAAVKISASSKLKLVLSSSDPNVAIIRNDSIVIEGAGTTTIKAIQAGNYLYSAAADSMKTFVVAKADLAAKADDKSKTYGDANPALTVTYSGFVNNESSSVITTAPTITTTATPQSAAGNYDLTVGSDGVAANYNIEPSNGKLTINKASVTAKADDKTKTYGDANPAFTISYTGFVNNDNSSVITMAPTITTTASAASVVGSYDIALGTNGSAANYNVVPSVTLGKLIITKANLTAKADDMTRKRSEANPAFTITYTGFVNGDTKASITEPTVSCTADANSAAGTYPISLSGGSAVNYNIILTNGTLTVTPGTPVNTLQAAEVMIYPNPASNVMKVKRASSVPATLMVFDGTGAKVIEKKLISDEEEIDITKLSKGIYILHFEGMIYKVVVQ